MAPKKIRLRLVFFFLLATAVAVSAFWFAGKRYSQETELVSAGTNYTIDGQWLGTLGQTGEVLFDFQSAGGKLTGTVANAILGEWKIREGKINGDQIAFKQIIKKEDVLGDDHGWGPDWTLTLAYSGKINGGEIEMRRLAWRDPAGDPKGLDPEIAFTAKRAPEGTTLETLDEEEIRKRGVAWREKYYADHEGTTRLGELAPDFNLKMQNSNEWVRLSDFRGEKMVALVFGSYT
ncbi:MAG: hypothetical protein IH846_13895 [Acidobacteria bacterium]|nr:hypothetical protein [Acidobacteriota bacterium]MCZ6752402.1 hypothetical protein [Acidobacteriota bacterium]